MRHQQSNFKILFRLMRGGAVPAEDGRIQPEEVGLAQHRHYVAPLHHLAH